MSGIDLAALGIKAEELQDRVIERICEKVLSGVTYDEDGEVDHVDSSFKRKLDARITQHIDGAITALADKHVAPGISALIEGMCLQQTNQWGEKRGQSVTFIEYLTKRAEAYFLEDVDYNGKPKGSDGYNWNKYSTRGAWMINQHIAHSIETAMKAALASANSQIAGGIEQAIKHELAEILAKVKVTANTGR